MVLYTSEVGVRPPHPGCPQGARTCYPAVSQAQRLDGGALGLANTLDRFAGERDVARLVAAERHLAHGPGRRQGSYRRRAGAAESCH